MRKVQARSENNVAVAPVALPQPIVTSQPAAPVTATVAPAEPATAPEAATTITTNPTPITATKFYSRPRGAGSYRIQRDEPLATNEVAQPVAAPPEKSVAPVRIEAPAQPKSNTPLSPQLITPAKASAPKAKVIQWP